jgi:antitoxin (DNA-binding transcriptional repressor) of toxin-antitoxin stability system
MQYSSPVTILTAGQVRQQLGEIINRAYYTGETFIVQRAGQPMIKIVAAVDPASQQAARDRFWTMTEQIRAHVAQSGLSADEVQAVIDETIAEVRAEKSNSASHPL